MKQTFMIAARFAKDASIRLLHGTFMTAVMLRLKYDAFSGDFQYPN